MTSKQIENHHVIRIKEILSEGGITCLRSPHVSTESEYGEEEEHLEVLSEESGESLKEEQVTEEQPEEETEPEEPPALFPTPSLRKVLPDHIRKLEQFNRIHVLPIEFNKTIDPLQIPKIATTARRDYIDILAALVGCTEYRSSLAEFWFLDTMANMLRRAQEDGFDRTAQATLMLWFCELMKEIQHFDAADRVRFLRRIRDNMLAAAAYVATEDTLPTPADVGVSYRAPAEPEVNENAPQPEPEVKYPGVTFNTAYECSVTNLTSILHYFYDLFSTDYQFELVRSIFTATPEYLVIDASHQLQVPKSLYTVAKPAKSKPPSKDKGTKDKRGAAKKILSDTTEFLRLMEIKQKEELELLAIEERERSEWEKRTHILPLSMAIDEEFFLQHWPGEPALDSGKKKGKK